MYQIGWFSTGRDKAARDLLETVRKSIQNGAIKAEIAFIFCSREAGESPESDLLIRMVQGYKIPLIYYSYQKFKSRQEKSDKTQSGTLPLWRLDYDREVMRRLADFRPDICVLAGYMLITGNEMCQKYNMINLHPAAPGGPAGTWQEVIWQLMGNQAQETGVMMHLVTPELDRGPAVTYCTFSIRGKPFNQYWAEIEERGIRKIRKKEGEKNRLFQLIRQHGLRREFPLTVATIRAFSEDKVRVTPDKRVVDAQGKQIKGYDLTAEIEKVVK